MAGVYFAAEARLTLSTWQFVIAVVMVPTLTLASIWVAYVLNSRKEGQRAEQVKQDLIREIDRIDARVREVETVLRGEIKEAKEDLKSRLMELKTELSSHDSARQREVAELSGKIAEILARLPAKTEGRSA